MKDDMRLKSVVIKGPKAEMIPCLMACGKSDTCPCEKLQTYLGNHATGDITSLELEWIHVPTIWSVQFWLRFVFPIVTTMLLIALFFVKFDHKAEIPIQGYKIDLSERDFKIGFHVESLQAFEKGSNDVARLRNNLQKLRGINDWTHFTLQCYACLWKCRDLEINMLWTRLTLVGTFMALTYAGYGALILKGLDGIKNWSAFNLAAVGASVFGLLFSVLWTATAKGSKAWFERYEAMLAHFQETYKDLGLFEQIADEDQVLSYLDFNKRCVLKRTQSVDSNLFTQHAGAYSVSKIPIVMGQLSIFAWVGIGCVHLIALRFEKECAVQMFCNYSLFFACGLVLVAVVASVYACVRFDSSALKGE